MDQEPKNWIQILGHAGLIASLLFVGYQLKQDREIAIAATFQDRASAVSATLAAWAANPDAISGFIKLTNGIDPDKPSPEMLRTLGVDAELHLTPQEVASANFTALSIWFLWDNSHFQYSSGFLPESHWLRIRADIKQGLKGNPLVSLTYRNSSVLKRPGFEEVINELLAEIAQEENSD